MQSSLFSILSNAMRVCVYDSRQFLYSRAKTSGKALKRLASKMYFS